LFPELYEQAEASEPVGGAQESFEFKRIQKRIAISFLDKGSRQQTIGLVCAVEYISLELDDLVVWVQRGSESQIFKVCGFLGKDKCFVWKKLQLLQ